MVAFTEARLKNGLTLALSLVLLGMCCKTLLVYLEHGKIRETTAEVTDQLPGPSITICLQHEEEILSLGLLNLEEYPIDIMVSNKIKIRNGRMGTSSQNFDLGPNTKGTHLLPCITYNFGVRYPGLSDSFSVVLDSTDIKDVFFCLHDKKQYVPGWNSLFDTQCIHILKAQNQRFMKQYELILSKSQSLDTVNNPCSSGKQGDGNMCVLNSIQKKIGCRIKLLSNDTSSLSLLQNCSTREQIRKYAEALHNVTKQSPKSLKSLTGCKSTCLRNKWTPTFIGQSTKALENNQSQVAAFFFFPSGSYTVEKEILVHTWESVLAEFGGYLGLLLGTNVFSMICWVLNYAKTLYYKE